ncbi:MAG: Dabb family protein [Cellvibrionaceae bacterium]|nr:Dabb family protein [Cellvibrionaceae bacterium]
MIKRHVLVEFKAEATKESLLNFEYGIHYLAKNTKNLVSMTHYKKVDFEKEPLLSTQIAIDLPDFMSIWHFNDKIHLENFLQDTLHQKIAKNYFKPAVKKRTVFNCYDAGEYEE